MQNKFSDNGYIIVRNAISTKLIKNIKNEIYNFLKISKNKNSLQKYNSFSRIVNSLKIKEFDFVEPIFKYLHYKEYLNKLFTEPKFLKHASDLLGRDLAFITNPGLTLNLPGKNDPKTNYHFKDWHQEIWSGASPSCSVQIWTPLIQKSNSGHLEIIVDSHKWGHVPHSMRTPLKFPKNYKTKEINLNFGDVIIFSNLLLHRTMPTKFPRMALPCSIKNFKCRDESFQKNRSHEIYSYSEISKIEFALGNHYLSPYRNKKVD